MEVIMNSIKCLFLSILTVSSIFNTCLIADDFHATHQIVKETSAAVSKTSIFRSLIDAINNHAGSLHELADKGAIPQTAIDQFKKLNDKGLVSYLDPIPTLQLINTLSISLTGAGISFLGAAMIYKALEDYIFDTDTNQPLSTKKYVASGILGCSAVAAGLYVMAYARPMANKITVIPQ